MVLGGLLFDQLAGIRVLMAAVGEGVGLVIQGARAVTSVECRKVTPDRVRGSLYVAIS